MSRLFLRFRPGLTYSPRNFSEHLKSKHAGFYCLHFNVKSLIYGVFSLKVEDQVVGVTELDATPRQEQLLVCNRTLSGRNRSVLFLCAFRFKRFGHKTSRKSLEDVLCPKRS